MEERLWHKHYDDGVPTSIDYPAVPIDSFVVVSAGKFPENTALIFYGARINYRDLNRLVDLFAAALQALDVRKGDRVALYMPNCPQMVIGYYAVMRIGAIAVPSNPLYVSREIEHQMNDSGAEVMVCLSRFYENVRRVRPRTPLKHVIVTNIKEYFPWLLKILFTLTKEKKDGHRVDISRDRDTYWFQDVLRAAHPEPAPVEVTPDDTATLLYTGGTTGLPKGATLTHRNIVANAIQTSSWYSGSRPGREVMLTALPLAHSYAMTVCLNQSTYNSWAQVLIPNPRELGRLLGAVSKHHATLLPGVPTLYNAINHDPGVLAGKYDLKSIRVCLSGAAGLPPEVQQEFQRITGGKLVEGYGLSEASPVVTANPVVGGGKIGTIGIPVPDTDIKIVDVETETKTLGTGEQGVLCVSGPQVMTGYWNRPEETATVLRRDGTGAIWLHTGDIAATDKDGFVRILDRKKDMILAGGGLNVFPREVEDVLYEHPKVLEAAAIGVPVGSQDQRCKIFVVLKPGEQATEKEILDFCRERMASFRVPKYVEFRDQLPKSFVGKVLRRVLMDEESTKQNSGGGAAS